MTKASIRYVNRKFAIVRGKRTKSYNLLCAYTKEVIDKNGVIVSQTEESEEVVTFQNIMYEIAINHTNTSDRQSIAQRQLIITDLKGKKYTSIGKKDDLFGDMSSTISREWLQPVKEGIATKKQFLWGNNLCTLHDYFIAALEIYALKHWSHPVDKFESLMLISGFTASSKKTTIDYNKIRCPDTNLCKIPIFEYRVQDGQSVYRPTSRSHNFVHFNNLKALTTINHKTEIDKLNTMLHDFVRDDEELQVYKTLISWMFANMLKKQLMECGTPLYPALILIGDKNTGKSTIMKICCDVGFVDHNFTGDDFRSPTLKIATSTVFPLLFNEIQTIDKNIINIFKDATTDGIIKLQKGLNSAEASNIQFRLINPVIFSANNLKITDSAMLRRFYIINFTKGNKESKSTVSIATKIKKISTLLRRLYKFAFTNWIPHNITNNDIADIQLSLDTELEKLYGDKEIYSDNDLSLYKYFKFGERLMDKLGILSDVRFTPIPQSMNLQNGKESYLVSEKRLVLDEIIEILRNTSVNDFAKNPHTVQTILSGYPHLPSPYILEYFSTRGIFFTRRRETDGICSKICITTDILSSIKGSSTNKYGDRKYNSIKQLAGVLDKKIMKSTVCSPKEYDKTICVSCIDFDPDELYTLGDKEDNNIQNVNTEKKSLGSFFNKDEVIK